MSIAAPPKPLPMSGATGYQVARPGGKCAVTGADIPAGEKFMAALRESPAGFERVDVSLGAWPGFDRGGVVADWQTMMPRPEQKKQLFVDDGVLCDLFERLASTDEPAKLNFRFVLGLILMRKRLLSYETTRVEPAADGVGGTAGREFWAVKLRGRPEPLEMLNPKLDEQQVGDVSRQLGEILNEGI